MPNNAAWLALGKDAPAQSWAPGYSLKGISQDKALQTTLANVSVSTTVCCCLACSHRKQTGSNKQQLQTETASPNHHTQYHFVGGPVDWDVGGGLREKAASLPQGLLLNRCAANS